jgi:hypothetical protein
MERSHEIVSQRIPADKFPPATDQQRHLMDEARLTRDAALDSMHALEAALGAAAPTHERQWNELVSVALDDLRDALARHTAAMEEPGGLYEEIDITRPTLARRVEQLRRDHVQLMNQISALQATVRSFGAKETPDFADIRDRAATLLTAIHRHRAAETDLVFESFYTDIGAAD